jgi:CRISPR/Cas system-associated endonuclease Cas1
MANVTELGSLARLLRPLRRELSLELAEALLRLKADAEVQQRYEGLAAKNTEGELTPDERDELESLVRANSILSVLKAEAHAFLQEPRAA